MQTPAQTSWEKAILPAASLCLQETHRATNSPKDKESAKLENASNEQMVKLLPVLTETVENAIGIEAHNNRYFADDHTTQFINLLGGYVDGKNFVPVRFGIKESINGNNTLYIVVCDEGIKKDKVINMSRQNKSVAGISRLSNINIAKVIANVKDKKCAGKSRRESFIVIIFRSFCNERDCSRRPRR